MVVVIVHRVNIHAEEFMHAGGVSGIDMEYKNLRIYVTMTSDFASKVDIVVMKSKQINLIFDNCITEIDI